MTQVVPTTLFSAGCDALREDRLADARDLIERAVALAPGNGSWHATLANTCLRAGDLAAARASMERAFELLPSSARIAISLGNLQLRAGDAGDAERSFRRAVNLDPSLTAAWVGLGRSLDLLGADKAAEEAYIRALGLEADQPAALNYLALAAERRGELAIALEHRTRLAELKTSSAPAQRAEAGLRMQIGDYEGALAVYRRLAALQPDHGPTAAVIAELQKWVDRGDQANLEASAHYYDGVYASSAEYAADGGDIEWAVHWEWICSRLVHQGIERVIDIGCGPGQFAQYLREHVDIPYLGVDFSPIAIAQARSRCVKNADFLVANVMTDPLPDVSPSAAIICTEVLEHIADDLELIRRFPENRLCFCSVPNFYTFSHVRYFSGQAEVDQRYRPLFRDFSVERLQLSRGRNALYVFSGRTIGTGVGDSPTLLRSPV